MDTIIEYLISEFHSRDLPAIAPRDKKLPCLPGKIDTVIGMRRVGKTYFLYQIIQNYLAQKVPKQRLLYLNFDDDRLLPFKNTEFTRIIDIFYRLYPENKREKCYIFFDEIQNIPGWEVFVRRLLDTENVQITLTGSSAKLLSREIATTLRGRSLTTELFPLNLRESLIYEKISADQFSMPFGSQKRALLENRLHNYLTKGGFPEVQTVTEQLQISILQEYVDVVLFRDIIERYQIGNIQPLRHLILKLLNSPATLFSINKFYNDLKTQGISCSKDALHDYLDYLSDAFLIYPVSIYTRSERKRRVNPRKIYIIDTGLANAFLNKPHSDWGRLLENFVYMELRRHYSHDDINYYRTIDGFEVDFIVTTHRGQQSLIQVTLDIRDNETRDREIKALAAAMVECKLKAALIITLNHKETIEIKQGKIEIIPAWQWVMEK